MHTKDKLAAALREVGLTTMADKAAEGYYHDFLSPLDFPEMALAADLAEVAAKAPSESQRDAILSVRSRHLDGEFDANLKESEEWASGPEGQDAFERLASGK